MKSKIKYFIIAAVTIAIVVIVIRLTPSPSRQSIVPFSTKPPSNNNVFQRTSTDQNPSEDNLLTTGKAILTGFQQKEVVPILDFAHYDLGLLVKPYYTSSDQQGGYIDLAITDTFSTDTQKYKWGSFQGSGQPITLTNSEYFSQFIYNVDFLKAPQISFNKTASKSAVKLENIIKELFKDKETAFIEYYYPGFDPKYEGMDWQALCLVFQKYDGQWWLVAILHGQWGP